MKRIVEFETENGELIFVEVNEPEASSVPVRRGFNPSPSAIIEKAQVTFEAALEKVQPVAASVLNKLRVLDPDEATVEFGMALSLQAGAILASGTSDAHYRIKLTWRKRTE